MSEPGVIASHRYGRSQRETTTDVIGKDLVRVARVVRQKVNGQEQHQVIEYTVRGECSYSTTCMS